MFVAKARSAVNKVATVPAPIGGLNARDSLATMPETDAIVMRNLWPQPYGCSVRKGYALYADTMPVQGVTTLAVWSDVDGSSKMFAWCDDSMFDITTGGAATSMIASLAGSVWQTVSMVNTAGSHLICVNGVDDGIIYDAGGDARLTLGDGIVANTWAGLDPQDAVQVTVHQGRLWAVQVASATGWYLPVGAIQGTFVSFDFGPLFSRGGYLQYLTTWTIDDGNGAEDHLVAVSSNGEIVVYGGTDPSDDTKWTLVGVYYSGAPVSGYRGFTKVAGDLVFVTQRGVVSLSALLASTKVNESDQVLKSSKIQFLISELTASYSALFGWQAIYVPPINMLLINVPTVVSGGNTQLAANELMSTEPWTQFSGMDAASWCLYDNKLYFGDYTGKVYQAWIGNQDNGVDITFEVQQAYSYLKAPAVQKQVGMYRPNFMLTGTLQYGATINYDFQSNVLPVTNSPVPPATGDLWNTALWNVGYWSGALSTSRLWNSAQGIGVAASLSMTAQTSSEIIWVSTDYSYKVGTLL